MIVEPTKCPQLEGSSNEQKIGENWMIAHPTKGSQLECASNQQKIVKNWMIANRQNAPK